MGRREQLSIAVISATPGADTNVYNLFNSVTSFGGGLLPSKGASRVNVNIKNSHAGTIRSYRSGDKGTTWTQFGNDIVVPAAGATDVSGPYMFLVDTYRDVKIDWVNGGSAQTTWLPEVTMVCGDRSSGT